MKDEKYIYDFFISYRRNCGGALSARYIKTILTKYGMRVFLDVDDIKVGEYYPQIDGAIKNSKIFILILNEDSWREQEVIDTYYKEIIKITQMSGAILPIEFRKGVLCNIPKVLDEKLERDIQKFEKISYSNDYHFNLESILCEKVGLEYQPDEKRDFPQFSLPYQTTDLINRDSKVDDLCDMILKNRFSNLIGIGGSGKTSLVYLLNKKYGYQFANIAYVVVNGDIREDFVGQINTVLKLNFGDTQITVEEKYIAIIDYLEDNYNIGNNLIILDINETSDKNKNEHFATELINNTTQLNKIYPNNWKILVLSRVPFGVMSAMNLNKNEEKDRDFLKELFLKKAGERYNDFADFDILWKTIFYNPLLAEQLGIYLEYWPGNINIENISNVLYRDLPKVERVGITSQNRHEIDKTLICFLKNLINYNQFDFDEQQVLRHFVLWDGVFVKFEIIEDLLENVCCNLNKALVSLSKKSVLSFDKTSCAYKLHGLLATSLREQIDIKNENWEEYLNNVKNIINNDNYYKVTQLAYFIGNRICDITKDYHLLVVVADKFREMWELYSLAAKIYGNSLNIIKQLLIEAPNNIALKGNLAAVYLNLASLQHEHGEQVAEENYKCAIKILTIITDIAKLPKYIILLSLTYDNYASFLTECKQDYILSKIYYNKSIELNESVTKSVQNNYYFGVLANTYHNLGFVYGTYLNDCESAKNNLEKSIRIYKQLLETTTELKYKRGLVDSYTKLADLQQLRSKEYNLAEINYKKAIKISQDIICKNNNPEYQNGLAILYINLASLQTDHLNEHTLAETNYNNAIRIVETISSTTNNPEYLYNLILAYGNLTQLLEKKLNNRDMAEINYNKTVEIYNKLLECQYISKRIKNSVGLLFDELKPLFQKYNSPQIPA